MPSPSVLPVHSSPPPLPSSQSLSLPPSHRIPRCSPTSSRLLLACSLHISLDFRLAGRDDRFAPYAWKSPRRHSHGAGGLPVRVGDDDAQSRGAPNPGGSSLRDVATHERRVHSAGQALLAGRDVEPDRCGV